MKYYTINCPYCYTENKDITIDGESGIMVCCNCGQEIYVAVRKKNVRRPIKKSFWGALVTALFSV